MIGKHSMQLLARHFFWNNFFVRCGRPLSLFFLFVFVSGFLSKLKLCIWQWQLERALWVFWETFYIFRSSLWKITHTLSLQFFLTVSQFLDMPRLYIWQWLLERTLSVLYETFYVLWVVLCKITEICFRSSIWFAKGPIKSEKNLWK